MGLYGDPEAKMTFPLILHDPLGYRRKGMTCKERELLVDSMLIVELAQRHRVREQEDDWARVVCRHRINDLFVNAFCRHRNSPRGTQGEQ
jgi:hypothetical protein